MAKESAAVLPLPNGAIIKDAPRADATELAICQAAAVMCELAGVDCLEEDLRDFLNTPDALRLRSELEGVLLHVLLKRKARHLTKLKELAH